MLFECKIVSQNNNQSLILLKLTHRVTIKRRFVMKLYDELKAQMKAIKQQMAETKKNELTDAPKKVNGLCKELSLASAMLRVLSAKGRGEK